MKYLAIATLCLFPVLSVAQEPMQVGIAVKEITPPLGYPMAGYFHARGGEGVTDPLQAKAIVFQQGDERIAFVVCDILNIQRDLAEVARKSIEEKTGIPAANVSIAATHTHTGPGYSDELDQFMKTLEGSGSDDETVQKGKAELPYIPYLVEQLTHVVEEAANSVEPVALSIARGKEETVAFNRRMLLKDGTVRTWARYSDENVVKPAGPTDPDIEILTINKPDSKTPFAALVNFSLHCDTVASDLKATYSADYPGYIERVLRTHIGPQFISVFATAPCGDINHSDPTGKTRRMRAEIGERIANAANEAIPSAKPITPDLGSMRKVLDMPLQTFTDEDLAWARDIAKQRKEGKSVATTLAAKARRIERLHSMKEKKGTTSLPAEVQAFRIADDVAIVTLPGEIFVELGLAIEEASPFEHTIVVELANGSPAYVPTEKAFKEGGYEVENSMYAPGSGEKLVATAVELLNQLSKE